MIVLCIGSTRGDSPTVRMLPVGFEWTANLVVINRRKTLVVVHAASGCSFVLYGLTVKTLPKLPERILILILN